MFSQHGLRSEWQHHKVRLMDIVPRVEMQEKWFAAELAKMVERRRLLSPNVDLPGAALYLWHKHVICVRCKVSQSMYVSWYNFFVS
jgi:hypothetical protein